MWTVTCIGPGTFGECGSCRTKRGLHRVRAAAICAYFVHMEAPIYLKGRARPGPTFREAVLMHAVARLALHPLIPNILILGQGGS
jgi:hypothetical protein